MKSTMETAGRHWIRDLLVPAAFLAAAPTIMTIIPRAIEGSGIPRFRVATPDRFFKMDLVVNAQH